MKFSELKNGDIFRWRFDEKSSDYSVTLFFMVNNSLHKEGQVLTMYDDEPILTWFRPDNDNIIYQVVDHIDIEHLQYEQEKC